MPTPLYGGQVAIFLFIFVSDGLAASPIRFAVLQTLPSKVP